MPLNAYMRNIMPKSKWDWQHSAKLAAVIVNIAGVLKNEIVPVWM